MKEKITFNDLNKPLKFIVVCGWIITIWMAITFLLGFIAGYLGV